MTTIVYDHKRKQIACDSRCTGDGVIKTDSLLKYRYSGAALFFFTGPVSDHEKLVNAYSHGKIEKCEANAIICVDGKVILCGIDGDELWLETLSYNQGIGSGFKFALAALDFGNTAEESVKYAITRDFYSGGKVHVYDIESAKFLE